MDYKIQADLVRTLLDGAFTAKGLSHQHVNYVVDSLLEPSLRGVDTHGICLAPTYLSELSYGRAKVTPNISEKSTHSAVIRLDAGDALGLVSSNVATELVIERAKRCGIAAVAVSNSNHFGAASVYTLKMAKAGLIGLSMSHSDALVAPFNGLKRMLGTNPFSFAAPGSEDELYCLDMATSQVAFSKIKQTMVKGLPLQSQWCVDVDVEDVNEVVLKPLGGYKGQGLGVMVQMLSGLLTGMMFDHQLSHLYESVSSEPRKVGHFMIAMDIAAFTDKDLFLQRVHELLDDLRNSPSVTGQRIVMAGDLEKQQQVTRAEKGIPINQQLHDFFSQLADEQGIAFEVEQDDQSQG